MDKRGKIIRNKKGLQWDITVWVAIAMLVLVIGIAIYTIFFRKGEGAIDFATNFRNLFGMKA